MPRNPEVRPITPADAHLLLLERLERLEDTLLVLTYWLVQAQTGLGVKDLEGIEKRVGESRETYGTDFTELSNR